MSDLLILRTRRVLEAMQREQEALGRELEATGLTSFADRADWLIAHRSPLEALAAELRQAALDGWHPSHSHLGMRPPVKRMPRPHFTERQLEIAMRALDNQEAGAA